jgi:hypothetical protein
MTKLDKWMLACMCVLVLALLATLIVAEYYRRVGVEVTKEYLHAVKQFNETMKVYKQAQ